ncbi:MAG: hypothetical protein KatS3mg029_0994 [Saprospiraceae bacterium]|nr:MAG: hypothetical protein KatS3mg029_0994 [Saprospiraceae bacterium]
MKKFEIKHALVCLDLSNNDKAVLDYLSKFKNLLQIQKATVMHVVPAVQLYHAGTSSTLQPITTEVAAAIQQMVAKKQITEDPKKTKVLVVEGDPLEEILAEIEKSKIDLVVLGKSEEEGSFGLLMKNTLRKTTAHALVVPAGTKKKLSKIMVPFDFSPNSIQALKTALRLNERLDKPAKVFAVNVYELPSIQTYRIGKTEEEVRQFLLEDRREAFQHFLSTYFTEEERQLIDPQIVELKQSSIGKELVDFADKKKVNLIVQGAKGHSKVALLLLGSVSEKVLQLTKHIPVLVIR